MKKLTRKFKEGFANYDYSEQDIDVLLGLLDIILEMMGIVEMTDHDYIKKLSSFTRLLSSGYSNTILDAVIIESIYHDTILPILDHFDEKYTTKFVAIASKDIVNGIPHTEISVDDRVLKITNDFIENKMDVKEYRKLLVEMIEITKTELDGRDEIAITNNLRLLDRHKTDIMADDIILLNKFISNNRDTNDPDIREVIFNMTKDTVGMLHFIYDSFTSGKSREHNEKYLQILISLRNTMETISNIDDAKIQLMADTIRSICYSLMDEVKRNDISPPSSIMMIELKFKSLEDIRYRDSYFENISKANKDSK